MIKESSLQSLFPFNTYKKCKTSSVLAQKNKRIAMLSKLLSLLILFVVLPALVSCGDEDEQVPLESVIAGKWYSYKADIMSNGNKKTVSVTQNGEYASFYHEVVAASNGTAVLKTWELDETSQVWQWGKEENCVFTIQDNELTLIEPSGNKTTATYDPKDRIFILTYIVQDYLGNLVTANIYFKK